MRECRGRGRVGQVVGRHVHSLYRSDRAVLRGRDSFLHLSHFGSQCRLITHGRGHTSQQGGHFGTGLGETEDVVDEEQDVTRSVSLLLSRKDSAKVRPESATEERAPGGSFICPNTMATWDFSTSSMSTFDRSQCPASMLFRNSSPYLMTPDSIISRSRSLPSRVRSPHTGEHGKAVMLFGNVVDKLLD